MTQQILVDGVKYGIQRGQINSNFTELYTNKIEANQVLTRDNTDVYSPSLAYHPATKGYADGLMTAWQSLYNPQAIDADVFARANHTGLLDPDLVDTDSIKRFVSDTDVANWDGKENSIETKNTAFNKNFGITAGTIAEGNHIHTATDIGLGNVDNTRDTDKPVSTATQTALDGKEAANANIQAHISSTSNPHSVTKDDVGLPYVNNTSDVDKEISAPAQVAIDLKLNKALADFDPQVSEPAYVKGRTFYSNYYNALVTYSDISGVPHIHGQGSVIRIINKSSAILYKGAAVRHNGVDATTELPKVELALADTLENSRVLGVISNDIEIDAEGFISISGPIYGFDTSLYGSGVPLYLSDTVPGAYTTTPPDLVTQVGGVLVSGASGSVMISIINHIALPTLFGLMKTSSDTPTLTSTFVDIGNFSTDDSIGIPVNTTTGKFSLGNDGWYRAHITTTISSDEDPPSGSDTITIRLWNVTQSVAEDLTTITIPSTSSIGDFFSRSASFLFEALAGDDVVFQIASTDHSGTITFETISVDVESKNIN